MYTIDHVLGLTPTRGVGGSNPLVDVNKKGREVIITPLLFPENWKPVCMLYIGYPADDFVPNTSLGGHRKPLSETCFYNELPEKVID